MHPAGVAAREQAAVLEEDVDQLPQQVVGGLDQLLAHARVGHGRLELPLRPRRLEGHRQAAARPRRRRVRPPPKVITMSSGSAVSSSSVASEPLSPVSPSAGSARLPTITGWTNSTATWRASERLWGVGPSASSRPPRAKRSAIRWQSRASRSASAAK